MQSAHFAALPPSCRAAAQSRKLRAAQLRGCVGALARRRRRCASRCTVALSVRADIGGEYIETYGDVDKRMLDYFTFRALRMSLNQLQETDTTPGKQEYTWLYNFAVENPPSDSVSFLRALLDARQDYGERLIEQRLVVYQRWVKTFSPDRMNAAILEANKQLLLETLMKGINMSLEVQECSVDGKPVPCEDNQDTP